MQKSYTLSCAEIRASIPDFPLTREERKIIIYKPEGCLRCSNTGYRGRVGVYELMLVSDTIKNLTLQYRSTGEIAAAAIKEGIVTLCRDGLNKVREGITSVEEPLRVLD